VLVVTTTDDRQWVGRANCRNADTDLFFPPDGEIPAEVAAMCRECDVRRECLAYALGMGEDARGIWAGTGERMRRRMRSAGGIRRSRIEPDHGTDAGYKQHERLGEPACRRCLDAHALYQRSRPSRAEEVVGW
jgi:WhiB family redox-sensing transcriptional regulator